MNRVFRVGVDQTGPYLDIEPGLRHVRGSSSARVSRSSKARVRRVVPHNMEEEGEDQEDEKDDGREDGQQGVEGRVAESQNTHIVSA